MAIPQRTIRGVQDIRTIAGRADQEALPYKIYMRVCCLEMEEFRRNKERESALQRVRNIDARIQEIKAEKTSLMQSLNERPSNQPVAVQDSSSRSVSHRSTDGIKVRY